MCCLTFEHLRYTIIIYEGLGTERIFRTPGNTCMTLELVFDKEHCATRWKGPGSIYGRVFGNFQMAFSFFPRSVTLGSTQHLTEMRTKEVSCGYNTTGL
jgi:hypothetical protein